MTGSRGVRIELGNINVNRIDSASGIFVGTNTQWGWSSHGKRVSGFGSVTGMLNRLSANIGVVYDNDLIDTPIDDRDVFAAPNGEAVIAAAGKAAEPAPAAAKPPAPVAAKPSAPAGKAVPADSEAAGEGR